MKVTGKLLATSGFSGGVSGNQVLEANGSIYARVNGSFTAATSMFANKLRLRNIFQTEYIGGTQGQRVSVRSIRGSGTDKTIFESVEGTKLLYKTQGPSGDSAITLDIDSGTITTLGTLTVPSLKIATDAADGKVLTSDATGNATWQAASGGGSETPTLQAVTTVGATSSVATVFTGGFNSYYASSDTNTRIGSVPTGYGTGTQGVAIGYEAGKSVRSASTYVAVGNAAGHSQTASGGWVAVGNAAGYNSTVPETVAIGSYAGFTNVNGWRWTALGSNAAKRATGSNFTAIGESAGGSTTSGSDWTALGYQAGLLSKTASYWTALGRGAAQNVTSSGGKFIAIGNSAAELYSDGGAATNFYEGVYIGNETRVGSAGARNEIVIGLSAVGSGSNTVTIGNSSITGTYLKGKVNAPTLRVGTTATAGQVLTADSDGNATWQAAGGGSTPTLQEITGFASTTTSNLTLTGTIRSTSSSSERFGRFALNSDDGSNNYNAAFGYQTMQNTTSGNSNAAFGYQSLMANTTQSRNAAFGYDTLNASTADFCTAIGYAALQKNTTGFGNTAVGGKALYSNTTGQINTAIGGNAGGNLLNGATENTKSSHSIYIGSSTRSFADVTDNEIVIGYEALGKGTNTIQFGNANITNLHTSGQFNSSATSPIASAPGGTNAAAGHVLTADGAGGSSWVAAGGGAQTLQEVTDAGNSTTNNIVTTGTATASNFILSSDERLKTFKDESIVDVSSVDIKKFNYNNDETNRNRYGVSAQELRGVAPEMVYEDEDGLLSVGYTDFLLAKVAKQDKEIAELKTLVLKLIER